MTIMEGFARRFTQSKGGKAQADARFTFNESLAVATVEGENDEMSRAGLQYHLASSGATGIAPVQALPTTAAQWLFYNPTGSVISAFFDFIGAWLVSGTAGAGAALLAALCAPNSLPTTRPASVQGGLSAQNGNPNSARSSKLFIVSGATLLANPGWAPIALMNPAGTLLGQTTIEPTTARPRGRIVLPPDSGIALAVISPTGTTPLFAPVASWREFATDPE